MSVSLEKLKALRRQAGHTVPARPAGAAPVAIGPSLVPSANSPVGATPVGLGPSVATAPCTDTAEGHPASLLQAVPATQRETSVFGWVEQIQHKPMADAQAPQSANLVDSGPGPMVPASSAEPVLAPMPALVGNAAHAPAPASARKPQDSTALRRLLGLRDRATGFAAKPRVTGQDRHVPGEEIAPGLFLIEAFQSQPIPAAPLSLAFSKRDGEQVAPRDLLFFDTETTGLAGGTGTRAFMIGAADWHTHAEHGDGLRIRQLLITTMAAETAMLREFAGWLGPATVFSSYNGRCYDSPLLKTRYRLARQPDPISALDHVDLLFPTRRRYRGVWENCRLATIERQLLQIVREDDLPGSEAPAAWLNYLRGGSARNLRRVAEHNHQDVVTLAQLFLRLVEEHRNDDLQRELEAPIPRLP